MAQPDFKNASPQDVVDFHTKSDVDSGRNAQHHTIGPGMDQAASGAHSHDGTDSAFLWEGFTITGSRSNGQAVASIISLLVQKGAVDGTTP